MVIFSLFSLSYGEIFILVLSDEISVFVITWSRFFSCWSDFILEYIRSFRTTVSHSRVLCLSVRPIRIISTRTRVLIELGWSKNANSHWLRFIKTLGRIASCTRLLRSPSQFILKQFWFLFFIDYKSYTTFVKFFIVCSRARVLILNVFSLTLEGLRWIGVIFKINSAINSWWLGSRSCNFIFENIFARLFIYRTLSAWINVYTNMLRLIRPWPRILIIFLIKTVSKRRFAVRVVLKSVIHWVSSTSRSFFWVLSDCIEIRPSILQLKALSSVV